MHPTETHHRAPSTRPPSTRLLPPRSLPLPLLVGLGALVVAVTTVALAVGVRLLGVGATTPSPVVAPSATTTPVADTSEDRRALALLRGWDRRRAVAWAAADPVTLERLYTRGSPTGSQDVAMLRAWQDRGLRVAGLSTQVLSVSALRVSPRLVRLRVTDRVAAGSVERIDTGEATGQSLPTSRPSTSVVTLVRGAGEWRVRGVR
ncbi:hypothetical protein [Nocardioides bruguierae]|uniref:Uncharacterized protein n=1 Tax=Nocardioides bruguierae TaxID=2945102 RepID=A0A9X2IDR5_9ACTN|nr:hypothetical protein [Nocardioides bruguierae]MCM0619537.1 hypothetical protein [Nocardioides bruguierae]